MRRSSNFRLGISSLALFFYCPVSVNANYLVVKGDSLSKIADAQYGNWMKWKNLWKVNEDQVKNPDLIYPGQRLRLLTDQDLTLVADNSVSASPAFDSSSNNDAGPPVKIRSNKRSQEWSLLPQQAWEKFVFKTSPAVDPDGFDRRSRVADRVADKTSAEVTIASERIPILGEIVNARTEFERVFMGETVFIRADETLQVGTTYSITKGPQKIISKRDTRVGFAYDLTGKVKIVGVRDGVFIATVTALYHPIQRGQLLIPEVNSYEFPTPTEAVNPIAASVVVTRSYQDDMLGEQKVVFLDVGKDDGVKVGNIFRHYLHEDPNNSEIISAKDFMIESELEILSVQEKFSIAIILSGRSPLHLGDEAIALTDLSDFQKNQGLQSFVQDHAPAPTADTLDQMDPSDGIGEKENLELRQLEKWARPAPAAPLQPESSINDDEIKRLDVHEGAKPTTEIGTEAAPNDGSNKTQPAAPKPTPEPTPVPSPALTPAPPASTDAKAEGASESSKFDLPPTAPSETDVPQAPIVEAAPQTAAPTQVTPANPAPDPVPDSEPTSIGPLKIGH